MHAGPSWAQDGVDTPWPELPMTLGQARPIRLLMLLPPQWRWWRGDASGLSCLSPVVVGFGSHLVGHALTSGKQPGTELVTW
jgi:hypothetical protein